MVTRNPATHFQCARVRPRMRWKMRPLKRLLSSSSSKYSLDTGNLLLQLNLDAGLNLIDLAVHALLVDQVFVATALDDLSCIMAKQVRGGITVWGAARITAGVAVSTEEVESSRMRMR